MEYPSPGITAGAYWFNGFDYHGITMGVLQMDGEDENIDKVHEKGHRNEDHNL